MELSCRQLVVNSDMNSADEGVVALSLMHDLVTQLGLVCTSRLFEKEARLKDPMSREQLESRLGLHSTPQGKPLISAVLQGIHTKQQDIGDDTVSLGDPKQCDEPPQTVQACEPKGTTQGIGDPVNDIDTTSPTRIPSFVGQSLLPTNLQPPPPTLSREEASAPYPLPSDSGESDNAKQVDIDERESTEHEISSYSSSKRYSSDHDDSTAALDVAGAPDALDLFDALPQRDASDEDVRKPVAVALAPLPRNNLPPLGPVHAGQSHAIGALSTAPDASIQRLGAPTVRDARSEGRELLELLGNPGFSEDDDLPGLERLDEDPELFDDFGGVDGPVAIDLLLPDSSSESGNER